MQLFSKSNITNKAHPHVRALMAGSVVQIDSIDPLTVVITYSEYRILNRPSEVEIGEVASASCLKARNPIPRRRDRT